MAQQTMYPAAINSRQTELSAAVDATQTTITVLDVSVIPAAPNQLTIGTDETAETITYTGVSGSNLTGVTRGFQGTAKAWPVGTKVARYFTAYDHDTFRSNITDLNTRVNAAETPAGAQAKADAAQSAAAMDATTKANAAEASAKAYSDSKQTASIKPLEREVANLNLQLAAASRVSNGVTFGSNFADSFGMTFDLTKTSTTAALSAGATSITVASATGLSAGMEVTIYDDTNLERVTITSISGTTLTVPALAKTYKSGANVARTMAVLDATNRMLKFGGWTTTATNTVTDASVVGAAYDTSGNGGRKLVRLSNGWLVSAVYDSTNSQVKFFVSKDNFATTPTQLCYVGVSGINARNIALVNFGNNVYLLYSTSNQTRALKFDATTVTNIDLGSTASTFTAETTIDSVSITINDAGTELHATWASRNSTYPNSFNIRYAKGIIAGDGSITWGAIKQLSTYNLAGANVQSPSIVVNGSTVVIVAELPYDGTNNNITAARSTDAGNTWSSFSLATYTVYVGGSYSQVKPSAIFVPQSVNGLANGRIWVTWHGMDATDTSVWNIRISYSDDGGATWSAATKLTSGNTYTKVWPTITADKNNNIYILFYGRDASDANNDVRLIKNSAGSWGSESIVASGTTASKGYPSALIDLSLDITIPLFIYQDNQGGKIGFYGTWKAPGVTPINENDVRFTVKDTSEAVLWAQRDAALTVDATLNGLTMDKTTVSNEDQFVKTLGASGKAEIRVHMTRASTSADIGISRILGGVS
ncbi:Sialidase [compost metagenome]